MNGDFRNSVKLWVGVITFVGFVAICGAVLRVYLPQARLDDVFDGLPSWVWLLAAFGGLWTLGRFGWGLWQRRASKTS